MGPHTYSGAMRRLSRVREDVCNMRASSDENYQYITRLGALMAPIIKQNRHYHLSNELNMFAGGEGVGVAVTSIGWLLHAKLWQNS